MKKRDLLISFLMIAGFLFTILYSVNFDLPEFKLAMKALIGQELTLEEMKNTWVYKAYSQVGNDTGEEEINGILNKKSKNILEHFVSWNYPYGYLHVIYRQDEKPRVYIKVVGFRNPHTIKLTEEELHTVFKCSSLQEIVSILGEPAILGKTYGKDGEESGSSYGWGVRIKLTEEFMDEIEKKNDDYVRFPYSARSPINFLKLTKKYRLGVSIKADGSIESFDLDDYKK